MIRFNPLSANVRSSREYWTFHFFFDMDMTSWNPFKNGLNNTLNRHKILNPLHRIICWMLKRIFKNSLPFRLIILLNDILGGKYVIERTSYFWLARKLIWPLWSSHIFTQWGYLSYSARTIFPDNIKMVKAHQTIASSEPFEQDVRTFCLLPS